MQKIIRLKKGNILDLVVTPTFVTVLVLGIVLLRMLSYTYSLGDDLSYEKQFLATEHSLILDALHQLQGNALMVYSSGFNFSYSYAKSLVKVFDSEGEKSAGFFEDKKGRVMHKDLLFKGTKITPIIFSKEGNKIIIDSPSVNPEFSPNGKALACPEIAPEPLKSLTLDPGHGWNEKLAKEGSTNPGDRGFVNEALGLQESEVSMSIASLLQSFLLNTKISLSQTRDLKSDENKNIEEKINSVAGDFVLSIHTGSYARQESSPAKAYININSQKKEQSRKLACSILNSLSDSIPEISSVAIIPVNLELLESFDKENPKRVLLSDRTAVMLEIGNIQSKENNLLKSRQKEIAEAIYEGINSYQK